MIYILNSNDSIIKCKIIIFQYNNIQFIYMAILNAVIYSLLKDNITNIISYTQIFTEVTN